MEIPWSTLETSMRTMLKAELAMAMKPPAAIVPDKPVVAAQDAKVEATVDGKPVAADLIKPGIKAETKATMGAMGIAGIVESGDRLRLLRFELGAVTSALVGIPVGGVASKVISAWIPPYRDAAGATSVRPASIGFGQVNWLNPVAHVGGMVLVETYGANFLGRTAAHFIAGTLLVSTLFTYTPLGSWLDKMVGSLSPKTAVTQTRVITTQRQVQVARNGKQSLSWV